MSSAARHTAPRGLLGRLHGGTRRRTHESILAHLQALLSTRLGESLSAADLGLVDFADIVHGYPASLQVLRYAMQAMIARYEPRLTHVTITPIDTGDPLTLTLELTAQLKDQSQGSLHLRTELSASGKIHVSGA